MNTIKSVCTLSTRFNNWLIKLNLARRCLCEKSNCHMLLSLIDVQKLPNSAVEVPSTTALLVCQGVPANALLI